jgi:hypothetical protein
MAPAAHHRSTDLEPRSEGPPAAVVLWAHLPRDADAGPLVALSRGRRRARLFLGGPGWQAAGMHPHQLLPEGMDAAATEVERMVLGPAS